MKKDNKKKITLTICGFSVLCIGILAAAYFLTRKPAAKFVPAAVETTTQTDSWEEKTATETESAAESSSPSDKKEGTEADNTQKIISEDETTTTSSLSDTKTKEEAAKEIPSEKPVVTEDATNPEKPPEYDSNVPQQTQAPTAALENKADSTTPPEADNNNSHAGQVYDPVFGWIITGDTHQDIIDSDGDINKQVGNMGGN